MAVGRIEVTVTFANHGTDPATAEFVVVGKKVNNLPVDLVQRDGDFVRIESHAYGISFEGRLHDGALEGTYEQGPMEGPLVLKRAPVSALAGRSCSWKSMLCGQGMSRCRREWNPFQIVGTKREREILKCCWLRICGTKRFQLPCAGER